MGLAIKRGDVDLVLPFGVFEWHGDENRVKELVELVEKEKINKIVFGLPLSLNGKETPNTERVRKFANTLGEKINVTVDFADERFSSYEADSMGGQAGRDEKSAMVILQEYLAME
jgi:putative Holliday junction resolvase